MAKKTGEKYEAIIEAAVKVIAKNGYHHSQVSKIAREAGVADGTIYLYFRNKDDILTSLFHDKMGAFIKRVKAEIDKVSTMEEKLYQLIYMHLKQLQSDPALAIVTQIELRHSNIEIRKEIRQSLKAYQQLIEELIENGRLQGTFRRNLDVRIVRQMIFGTLDETVTTWVMKNMKYDLMSQVISIYDLIVNAIKSGNIRG